MPVWVRYIVIVMERGSHSVQTLSIGTSFRLGRMSKQYDLICICFKEIHGFSIYQNTVREMNICVHIVSMCHNFI